MASGEKKGEKRTLTINLTTLPWLAVRTRQRQRQLLATASSAASVSFALTNLIAVSFQFEYDPAELATKIPTQFVLKSKSETYE